METLEKDAKTLTNDLFEVIGIDAKVATKALKEGEDQVVNVKIDAPSETGLLIGSQGSTLLAIQAFLGSALKQKTGNWVRVVVDIDDWREKQEDYLKDLAEQAAERTRSTGEPQHLYNLTPAQRRTIHMVLEEEKGVKTESQGEGENRYLVVTKE